MAYRATPPQDWPDSGRWRPSIHMPRWASRILLEITGVRVERLNGMSEEDALAEGCGGGHDSIPGYMYSATPHEYFHHVWASIYGEENWQDNPWATSSACAGRRTAPPPAMAIRLMCLCEVSMKLINRGNKQSPIARQACEIVLATHQERYGDYSHSKMTETYTVQVSGVKTCVEVVNRSRIYVATAMTGMRRLRALPGQVS